MIPFAPGRKVGHIVDPVTGCWEWVGARDRHGYGRVGLHGGHKGAHRAYRARVRPLTPGLELDHLCRNRGCVNPDHLEEVTHTENNRRGRKTKLTPEQVVEIRRRYAAGGVTQEKLGREFEVDQSHVSLIISHCYWKARSGGPTHGQ